MNFNTQNQDGSLTTFGYITRIGYIFVCAALFFTNYLIFEQRKIIDRLFTERDEAWHEIVILQEINAGKTESLKCKLVLSRDK